jgi:16S rRNA (uracil1498-N3)-methyltransferase
VERSDRAAVVQLFWDAALVIGEIRVDGAAAQHARVRRVQNGDAIRLVDGRGHVAAGRVIATQRDEMAIAVDRVTKVPRPLALEVVVPIADKDRMLLAAEKCVELQVTAWHPTFFVRSRSVSPRGEGEKFRAKVLARMQSALEQSGGAWMPDVHEDGEAADAWAQLPGNSRGVVLDVDGPPLPELVRNQPMVIAVGPEGGFERHELAAAKASGWVSASLGTATLRFETALIAGIAVIRSSQLAHGS